MQLNTYAFMLKRTGHEVKRILLVYISKFGPTECSKCKIPVEVGIFGEMPCPRCGSTPRNPNFGVKTIEVIPEPEAYMEKFFRDRKMVLEQAFETNVAPDGMSGWECRYCAHECPFRQE